MLSITFNHLKRRGHSLVRLFRAGVTWRVTSLSLSALEGPISSDYRLITLSYGQECISIRLLTQCTRSLCIYAASVSENECADQSWKLYWFRNPDLHIKSGRNDGYNWILELTPHVKFKVLVGCTLIFYLVRINLILNNKIRWNSKPLCLLNASRSWLKKV